MLEFSKQNLPGPLVEKARTVKLVLTDNDGVLTDNGVYYGESGEIMKRFSIRDGMGVERLRNLVQVETGIITGELSGSVARRAEKLKITVLHQGVRDKMEVLTKIIAETGFRLDQIAFIGDDTNDIQVMEQVGLSACPADATPFARNVSDFVCSVNGGHGAFRELAELIIYCKLL
jgi:3-deoxy-D-manno-octulosonate 8-phosphate phosphatase (KDO 8-P phosphatase)